MTYCFVDVAVAETLYVELGKQVRDESLYGLSSDGCS
jgi:hypothetical protein